METVGCLLGHEDALEVAFVGRDRLGLSQDPFTIRRCRECGLLFVSPRPTLAEIQVYYPYDKYAAYDKALVDRSWRRRWYPGYIQRKRCRFVESVKAEGRLLDVGCATGNFLATITQRGKWDVHGVEPHREAAEYARQRFGFDVFHGLLEQAHYPSDSFDVVTLWSVLEHLHDPLGALEEVRRILRPDGWLGLTVPYGDSLDARLFGRHWGLLDPPRHLYTFTRCALEQALEHTRFEVVRVQSFSAGYLSLWRSIHQYIQSSESMSGSAVKRVLLRLIPSPPFRVLSFPYVWATGVFGRGATISVLAKPV